MIKINALISLRIAKQLAVGLLSLCIVQCEFESTETWYNDIPEPEAEMATAELNFEDSVIIIDQATFFEYSLEFNKQEVYEVVFYLDHYKIGTNTGTDGSVLVDPSPGEHLFEMVVYTSTESGSIADGIGREVFTYSKSWTILSESKSAAHIQIKALDKSEESLRIEWERYQGNMFQSYELFKKTSQGDFLLYESLDVDQTSFFDQYFVGGSADYFVRFHKSNGDQFDSDTKSYSSFPGMIELDYDWEQHILAISWPKCEFENNFLFYQLSQRLNDGPAELIYTTEGFNDTTVTIPVGENQNLLFELVYHSKMPDSAPWNGVYSISSENTSTGSFYLPKPFPAYEVIAQSKTSPYRIYTPEYFYDVIEDKLIYRALAEHKGLFDVSDNNYEHISGLSHYRGDGEGWYTFWLDKQLSKIPPSVFENEERRACKSDYSFLIVESGSTTYFCSTRGDSIIQQFENDSLHWAVLSSYGHYIIAADLENNEIDFYYGYWGSSGGNRIWCVDWMKSLSGTAGNYVFKNNVEFAMIAGNKLEIRSVEAMTPENGSGDGLLLSTETSATRVVETDPISNTLLTCSTDRLFVYDLTDLRLLGEIPNTNVYQKVIQRGPRQVAYLNSTVFFMDEGVTEATMQTLPIDKWR